MKNIYLIIFFLSFYKILLCQDYQFSITALGGTDFFLVKSNSTERITQDGNFDGGILLSYKANKIVEISTGLFFFSKRFSEYFPPVPNPPANSWYESVNHFMLYYYRIPVIFTINLANKGKLNAYAKSGFSLGHLIQKERSTTYLNGITKTGFDSLVLNYRDPLFFDISAGIRYHLNKRVDLSLEPWFRYMYLSDFMRINDSYLIALSHSQIGISLGLNYNFNIP